MPIPENIKKFRPVGTEIQEHKGHYYVYKVKAFYDPVTKKSKRKSEGCIGQIIEGIGYVSNEKQKVYSNNVVKEYGATAFLYACSESIKNNLIQIFGMDGMRIYSMAILKLLTNSNQKNMEIAYQGSFISELIPNVHLSKNTISSFLEELSLKRHSMLEFFKTISQCEGENIIFDGSSFTTSSKENAYVNYGYNPNEPGKPQIRLIYGFNYESNVPVYFNLVPGNVTDKMAFVGSLKESGLKDCTIILDNGFYSEKNLEFMNENHVDFIIPISANLKVVKNFDLSQFEHVHHHFYFHKRTINYSWLESDYLGKYNLYIYLDLERRRELLNNYYVRANIKTEELDPKELQKVDEETKYLGFTFLISSKTLGAEQVFRQYKKRWLIEEMFDTHKNTLQFDMSYEVKTAVQSGWAFIEFVSLLIYLKAENKLKACKETKNLSVHDAFLRFKAIVKCKINNTWEIWSLDINTKKKLELLGVNLS